MFWVGFATGALLGAILMSCIAAKKQDEFFEEVMREFKKAFREGEDK